MKKYILAILVFSAVMGLFAASIKPLSWELRLDEASGFALPPVTNTSASTAPNYTATAFITARPGEVLTTGVAPVAILRIDRTGNGTTVPYWVRMFLNLSGFTTQWVPGEIVRVNVVYTEPGDFFGQSTFVEWEINNTSSVSVNFKYPDAHLVVPPYTPVTADTWTYNLQVNGPAGIGFTGPQNGVMPQLLTTGPQSTDTNTLLGFYEADAAPAGFHWAVNPIEVTADMFTAAKADYAYNATIGFELVPDPDVYVYNLYVTGPLGYAVTGPVNGVTNYMATSDDVLDLIGQYMIDTPPAGWEWVQNPINVTSDMFVLQTKGMGGRSNNAKETFVYEATIVFVLDEIIIPDTYTYNLMVNGPAGRTFTGPQDGTMPVLLTAGPTTTPENPLVGMYLAQDLPPYHAWVVNPIVVTADMFTAAKTDYSYNAAIMFEEYTYYEADPVPVTEIVNPPAGTIDRAFIVEGAGTHDVFIARLPQDEAAWAFIGGQWVAPDGQPDWTWLAVNFDAKATIPVVIIRAGYSFYVNSYDLLWWQANGYEINPPPAHNDPADLVSMIMWDDPNDAPDMGWIYTGQNTPYIFISGVDWLPGIYTVYNANYGYWLPETVSFANITTNYSVDFLGYNEPDTPVELSSFTATLTGQFYVQLTWVSQTETQMMGYLVYRGTTPNQANSVLIDHPMIPATNTSTTQTYTVIDNNVVTGETYYYWLEAVDYTSSAYHGPVSVTVEGNVPPVLPTVSTMRNAYPNPFRASGSTSIEVDIKEGENGTVTIYNVLGQVVKTVSVTPGSHTINWNGKDSRGNTCGSGIYFYKLSTPSINQTKKMVIVK